MSRATRHDEYVAGLPTFADAAVLIMIDRSEVRRAVKTLGIEPIPWGNREKHLAIADVFRIAIHAKRAALEEVGGGLLDWEHPDQVEAIRGDIDAFFASLPAPRAADPDELIADLRVPGSRPRRQTGRSTSTSASPRRPDRRRCGRCVAAAMAQDHALAAPAPVRSTSCTCGRNRTSTTRCARAAMGSLRHRW